MLSNRGAHITPLPTPRLKTATLRDTPAEVILFAVEGMINHAHGSTRTLAYYEDQVEICDSMPRRVSAARSTADPVRQCTSVISGS